MFDGLLLKVSIMLVPALWAVTLHEVAHGYIADRFGDPTARMLGRLTANPLKHLDPIGVVALLVFGFGWARPVPINPRNLRNPRRSMIWVALAGPGANFLLAIASTILLKLLVYVSSLVPVDSTFMRSFFEPLSLMAAFSLYINIILAVFNLLPVPPLDGGRVLAGVLPARQAMMLARIEPVGFLIVIFLIFFTPFWGIVLQPVINALVMGIAGEQTYLVARVISFLLGS